MHIWLNLVGNCEGKENTLEEDEAHGMQWQE